MPRKTPLKVYSTTFYGRVIAPDGSQPRSARVLIATTSQKRVAELMHTTVGEVRSYWTGANPAETRLALQHPEKVILIEDRFTDVPIVLEIVDDIFNRRKPGE